MMPGRASGVCRAALWNRTMEPGWTLEVTRWVMSGADRSFQSRLSPLAAASRGDLRAPEVDAQPRTNQIGVVQGWVIQPGQGGVILAQQLHLVLGKGV